MNRPPSLRGWGPCRALLLGAALLSQAAHAQQGALPELSAPERAFALKVPDPPPRPQQEVRVAGLRGEVAGVQLRLNGQEVKAAGGVVIAPGQVLSATGEGAHLDLIQTRPEGGFVLHLSVDTPCEIAVSPAGEVEVREGEGWAHLFRTLAEVLEPFGLTWEQVNTGFESTEIAVDTLRGRQQLVVIEGRVRVGSREERLTTGRRVPLTPEGGRDRNTPRRHLDRLIEQGTQVELALLPPERLCPERGDPALGMLRSEVCFSDEQARARALREARGEALRGDGQALATVGDVYLSAGRAAEAAGAYRRASQGEGPEARRALSELGNALWAAGQPQAAAAAFKRAVELDPTSSTAWHNLGVVSAWEGDLEGASDALERASELDPRQGSTLEVLGQVRLARGDARGAAQALQASREAGRPDDPALLAALARALRESGQASAAAEVSRRLVQVSPASKWPWYELARSEMAAGRPAEALRAWQQALQIEMDTLRQEDETSP